MIRRAIISFASGNQCFDSALKDASLQQNAALALEALDADVSTQPDHLPLIAAARVLFLQTDNIIQPYLHYHASDLKKAGILR
jgi:hypothetical protein